MEPSVYLDALVRDVLLFGGHIVIRKFESPRDVMSVPERVVVNCTGLGSRALFDDQSMVPLKGQLTELLPQPEVSYGTTGPNENTPGDSVGIHMNPRGDGIALGGTSERGVWTLEPNQEEMKRVVEGHIKLFGAMNTGRKA
jgi:glycine/D-amino acid oxidase-like deaminating enzyme